MTGMLGRAKRQVARKRRGLRPSVDSRREAPERRRASRGSLPLQRSGRSSTAWCGGRPRTPRSSTRSGRAAASSRDAVGSARSRRRRCAGAGSACSQLVGPRDRRRAGRSRSAPPAPVIGRRPAVCSAPIASAVDRARGRPSSLRLEVEDVAPVDDGRLEHEPREQRRGRAELQREPAARSRRPSTSPSARCAVRRGRRAKPHGGVDVAPLRAAERVRAGRGSRAPRRRCGTRRASDVMPERVEDRHGAQALGPRRAATVHLDHPHAGRRPAREQPGRARAERPIR